MLILTRSSYVFS